MKESKDLTITDVPSVAIILAGGLGTRLRLAVPDLPKCMAPVAGKPFISYIINDLIHQGVGHLVFSLGFLHEIIESYLEKNYSALSYSISLEPTALGTGGAIQLACRTVNDKEVLVLNGDSLFKCDIPSFCSFHRQKPTICSLALKSMQDFSRYGSVVLDDKQTVISFNEKQYLESGLINAGMYLLERDDFLNLNLPEMFSFEKDFLEKQSASGKLRGYISQGYFIDIGIPEDFEKAQHDFSNFESM